MKKTYILSLVIAAFLLLHANVSAQTFTVDIDSGCVPLTVTFTNTTADTVGKNFYWDFGDGEGIWGFETSHTYKRAGWHNVQLHIEGCCSSAPKEIQVFGADTFNISTGLEACPGENIAFMAYNDDYKWIQWNFGDGHSESWNHVDHKYETAGNYDVTLLYNSDQCGLDSIVQTINISDTAKPPETYVYVDGEEHCPNDAITFGIDQSYGMRYDSVQWNFGDYTYSNETHPQHAYTMTGVKDVIFTGWNSCGRSWSDTMHVIIKNDIIPYASIAIENDPGSICPNNKVHFYTNSSGDHLWDFGDGTEPVTKQSPNHFFADTGTYQVEVIITNSCGNSDTAYRDVLIEYRPGEKPNFDCRFADKDHDDTSMTICPGEEISFEAEAWDDENNIFYYWDFGDGGQSTSMNTSHVFDSAGTFNVMLIGTNNCLGSDTSNLEVIVDPNTIPDAKFNIFQDTICPGEKMYYNVNYNAMRDSLFTYSLWFGDGESIINTRTWNDDLGIFSHVYDIPGIYTYTLTATNICNNTDSLVDTVVVTNNYSFNPFIMLGNSTVELEDPTLDQIPDWSNPSSPDDHEFTIPVTWNQWKPGMEEKFYIVFADHPLDNEGDLPAGIIEFSGPGTATAYVPDTYDSIMFMALWYCNGVFSYHPQAFGSPDSLFDVNTGGETDIPFPGIEMKAENDWDGDCKDESGCPGDTVALYAFGGMAYEWYFGDGTSSDDQFPKHVYADTGVYNAFVVMTNGCGTKDTFNTTVLISNYNTPRADFYRDNDNICLNDTFQLFGQRDEGDFMKVNNNSYLWDFGDGSTSTDINPKHAYKKTGVYQISLTVTNGCGSTTEDDWYIYVDGPDVNFMVPDTLIDLTQSANFTNLTEDAVHYDWHFGDGDHSASVNPSHQYTFKGEYDITLTATNSRGCSASLTKENYIKVIELPVIAEKNIKHISCKGLNDGAIDITVTNGEPPFTYKWNNDATTQDIHNISAGIYSVTITDARSRVIDTFTVNEPTAINVSVSGNHITCYEGHDGDITLSPSGGTTPYQYQWLTGETTASLANLKAGHYHFTVTDNNGCSYVDSVYRTDTTNKFDLFAWGSSSTGCGGSTGAAQVNVTGSGSYSYLWNPTAQTTHTATGLSAGSYKVIVTDGTSGCKDSAYADVSDAGAPSVNHIMWRNVDCHGDSTGYLEVYASSGTPPYDYVWNTNPVDNDSIAENLPAGFYSVTVTDNNNCAASRTFGIDEPEPLTANITPQQPTCYHGLDGYAIVHAFGGEKPYCYTGFPYEDENNSGYKIAGTYNVTINDNRGCRLKKSYTITDPDPLAIDTSIYDVTVRGYDNGVINISMLNGTAPYTYTWSNGATSQDVDHLPAGTYSVTIADKNGCMNTISGLEINEPPMLVASITPSSSTKLCDGNTVTLDAGAGYNEYLWSTGETTKTIEADSNLTYYVTVTGNTSFGKDSVTITVQKPYENDHICIVTVDINTGNNMVVWEKTQDKGTAHYNVYKQGSVSNQFVYLGQISYGDTTVYTDMTSEHEQHAEIYKITAVDTCGNESDVAVSNAHKTLFLQYNGFTDGVNLAWSDYQVDGSSFNFDSYVIYRGTDSTSLQPLDTVAGNLNSYTDTSKLAAIQKAFYRVAGVKPTSCDPLSSKLKASAGPFSQSVSNLEDNRLKGDAIDDNLADKFDIYVYPNPAKEIVNIGFTIEKTSNISITLYHVTGKKIADILNRQTSKGKHTIEYNKDNLASGIYYLKVQTNNFEKIEKLIIQ